MLGERSENKTNGQSQMKKYREKFIRSILDIILDEKENRLDPFYLFAWSIEGKIDGIKSANNWWYVSKKLIWKLEQRWWSGRFGKWIEQKRMIEKLYIKSHIGILK